MQTPSISSLSSLPFTKMQGVGNDFVVVVTPDLRSELPQDIDCSHLAITLCDRHTGIGGDGLIVVTPSPLTMQFWNPDGTPDMCGNGLRCLIHLSQERGWVGERGTVQTPVGRRDFDRDNAGNIRVTMGMPEIFPPLEALGYTLHPIDTGSDHVVIFVEELPQDDVFFSLSSQIENHPAFPNRTSVMWTQRTSQGLSLRIWERGVGETLGCGTGACAVAVVYKKFPLEVQSKGGTLTVSQKSTGEIQLAGPAVIVFTGVYTPSSPTRL